MGTLESIVSIVREHHGGIQSGTISYFLHMTLDGVLRTDLSDPPYLIFPDDARMRRGKVPASKNLEMIEQRSNAITDYPQ